MSRKGDCFDNAPAESFFKTLKSELCGHRAFKSRGAARCEIFEYIEAHAAGVTAHWCANEKTAYEQALGVSMAGRRTLVSMKHVGLNVAADPFVNSALVDITGGLVVAVADMDKFMAMLESEEGRAAAAADGVKSDTMVLSPSRLLPGARIPDQAQNDKYTNMCSFAK